MVEISTAAALPVVLAGVTLASYILYNLFLHPLRHVPGPILWAATPIPFARSYIRGHAAREISELHKKYDSDIIRTGPNRLSFTSAQAYTEVRGHRRQGQEEHGKDRAGFYFFSRQHILGATREDHQRFRRNLSHGFSAKSMQAQQPLITQYVDKFIEQLRGKVAGQKDDDSEGAVVVDLVSWFNFVTFDVIGDLAFGSSFDCTATGQMHPWVQAIFDAMENIAPMTMALTHFGPVALLVLIKLGVVDIKAQMRQAEFAQTKIKKRLEEAEAGENFRDDFVDAMVGAGEKKGKEREMSQTEILQNARFLVLAGSETTATALSGAAWLLCMNPDVQRKLVQEVRTSFKSEDEIDMFSVNKLRYMLAVLEESMRAFPPVPNSLPRVCAKGGANICGIYVPCGTVLEIWPWAVTHSPKNFVLPEEFHPERWLDDENGNRVDARFGKDQREAHVPFSTGPRNCVGMNLAYLEMRLIMARLLWNFDLSLEDKDKMKGWVDRQRATMLWLKDPIPIKLTRAVKA